MKLTIWVSQEPADFPDNMDCEAAEYCYLSPEVLSGEHYKPRSDMYGLGLAAWELWNQEMLSNNSEKHH